MVYELPSVGESAWGQKVIDSFNAIKATADAAQPAAILDAAVTAVDADAESELRVQQDARLSATYAAHENGAPSINACSPAYGASPAATAAANTAAIHAARDALAAFSYGGVITLNPGVYTHNGLTLLDNILIDGGSKHAVTLKLADAANQHVIQAGDFDTNAAGASVATPVGCKSGGLRNLTIDGNKANQAVAKHGIAYYGIDMYLDNVEVKNAKGRGIYNESPGATYSTTVGQNLQYSWSHVEVHDSAAGGIYYNGQSDSTLLDIVCYENGSGAGQANFETGSKATGIRVLGVHCWGSSDYGLIIGGATGDFRGAHIESASVAKVRMNVSSYFEGRVYEAGAANAAPAFQLAASLASYSIRATVSACDTVVSFLGSDGGNALIEVQAYSANAAAVLFDATPNRTTAVRARLYGGTSRVFTQHGALVADTAASRFDWTSPGLGFAWWTDDARTMRQFAIEHTASATTYLAATGGTSASGPNLIARGTGADYDIRLTPKGAGMLRFGTRTASADAPITGYIEVKDSGGTVRKIAVID